MVGQLADGTEVSVDGPLCFAGELQVFGHLLVDGSVKEFGTIGFVVTGHERTPVKKKANCQGTAPSHSTTRSFQQKV